MYLGGNHRTLWYSSFCAFLTLRISKAIQLMNEGDTLWGRELYSRLPISNLRGKSKKFDLLGDRSRWLEIRKRDQGKECKYQAHFTSKAARYILPFWKWKKRNTRAWLISTWLNIVFNWTDKKVKTKSTPLFWNEFTVLNCSLMLLFFDLARA